MDFLNVSGITIPEGSVSKITETATGRVLWQRPSMQQGIEIGYPKGIILYKTVDGIQYHSEFGVATAKNDWVNDGYWIPAIALTEFSLRLKPEVLTKYALVTYNSNFAPKDFFIPLAKVGDEFTHVYVENISQRDNYLSHGKTSDATIWQGMNRSRIGYAYGLNSSMDKLISPKTSSIVDNAAVPVVLEDIPAGTFTEDPFLTLSASTGASVKIKTVGTGANMVELFNEKYPALSKTICPYILVGHQISPLLTSPFVMSANLWVYVVLPR